MKNIIFVVLVFIVLTLCMVFYFPPKEGWIKTEGELTEVTIHGGKRMRVSAFVTFRLENGTEQLGSGELIRIPFIGKTKAIGDKIAVYYDRENPVIFETVLGYFLSNYGMYILLFFGIIYSIKPFLKKEKYNK